MKAISLFRADILPDVPTCPNAIVDQAIRNAAIDFCRYTLTWRYTLSPINVVADTAEYALTPPSDSLIESIHYATHDDTPLVKTTEAEMDSEEGWRDNTTTSPDKYYISSRGTIKLVYTPEDSLINGLDIIVILKPTQTATTLADTLYDDHLEAISHGAKSRLFAKPGKPWTSADAAIYHDAMFMKAKRMEKAERLNDYTRFGKATFTMGDIYS